MHYVVKIIDNRLAKLQDLEHSGHFSQHDFARLLGNWKPLNLPLDAILKNNIALSYFIDYVTNIGQQAYLFFYLNVEGWKVTAEQQILNVKINEMKGIDENASLVYDKLRETAFNIYEQYLSEKSQNKLHVHSTLVQTLYFRIKNLTDNPSELWFDDIQKYIYEKLKTNDQFLPGFERSPSYLKLLAELDLLGQNNLEEDVLSISSLENNESSDTSSYKDSVENNDIGDKDFLLSDSVQKLTKHARSFSDISDIATLTKNKENFTTHKSESQQFDVVIKESESVKKEESCKKKEEEEINVEEEYNKLRTGNFTLSVDIIETGNLFNGIIYFFKFLTIFFT